MPSPRSRNEKRFTDALGQRLVSLRLSRGMSQEETSKRLGVATRTWIRYEHGENEMSVLTAAQIAELFGMSVDGLLYGLPVPRPLKAKRRS